MKENIIKISVRELVEDVMASGDITSGFTGSTRALEGIKGHQLIQNSKKENYKSEVSVKYACSYESLNFEISGRIDGVMEQDNRICIEEIKTTTHHLENIDEDFNLTHWAQAQVYAYIYSTLNKIDEISVKLTYLNIHSGGIKSFDKSYTSGELNEIFENIIMKYAEWARIMAEWKNIRNLSISSTGFPYKNYRSGQRELAVYVYRSIKGNNRLFAQAPTGTGKTIATLFPSIKAIGEDLADKIFYLTAKTSTRLSAQKAVDKLLEAGFKVKTAVITAKEKICFMNSAVCDPDDCDFAKGHFDRVKSAVKDIFLNEDIFTKAKIEEYARLHHVCPFEFSLDLSLWSDVIICDYNYVFDPRVYLKRFFEDRSGNYVFLIDEAHNLVDRAREMFSACLDKKSILKLKNDIKTAGLPQIYKSLDQLNKYMIETRKKCEASEKFNFVQSEEPDNLYPPVISFVEKAGQYLEKNIPSDFREDMLYLYFKAYGFLKTSEFYDSHYVTYAQKDGDDVLLKLFCLDPSYRMNEVLDRGICSVFFSATVTPLKYFETMIGGLEYTDSGRIKSLRLKSPFPQKNLCVIADVNISTKFRLRDQSFEKISYDIKCVIERKTGNYMVFFPSYKYMENVFNLFKEENPDVEVICQKSNMNESEKEAFLSRFENNPVRTLVGFAVMGGIFGEGIDLVGERLSGAVIVGVGLPQICFEREIIKNYFDKKNNQGYEYAYMYPGMNKVLQASGRVIRSESDRGVIVLIDERFNSNAYKNMFPKEWNVHFIYKKNDIMDLLNNFWVI